MPSAASSGSNSQIAMPRFHCPGALSIGLSFDLPAGAARHVQVLRLQPGDKLILFNGEGGEYRATIERMGRSDVGVTVDEHIAVEREAPRAIHLAVGMPANERMDWLVEKATELGVASIQPLMTAHAVLRLSGERAEKKRAHWEAIAVAACEQCGRNRVPEVHAPLALADWLRARDPAQASVMLDPDAERGFAALAPAATLDVLVGPEGGFDTTEIAALRAVATGCTTAAPSSTDLRIAYSIASPAAMPWTSVMRSGDSRSSGANASTAAVTARRSMRVTAAAYSPPAPVNSAMRSPARSRSTPAA